MSDTPETDYEASLGQTGLWVQRLFAERLERERNEARAALAALRIPRDRNEYNEMTREGIRLMALMKGDASHPMFSRMQVIWALVNAYSEEERLRQLAEKWHQRERAESKE